MYEGSKTGETVLEPLAASQAVAVNLKEIETLKLQSRVASLPDKGYAFLSQGLSHIKILHLSILQLT